MASLSVVVVHFHTYGPKKGSEGSFFNFVLDIFPVVNIFFILLYMILPVLGNTWLMDVGEYSKSCDLCEN